jgi:hypothetical protein
MKEGRLERFAMWQWRRITAPLLFLCATLVLTAAMCMLIINLPVHPVLFFVCAIADSVILFCTFILVRARSKCVRRKLIDQAEFYEIFGKMSVGLFTPGTRHLLQARVDTVLATRAARFDEARAEEEESLKRKSR